MKRLCLLLSLCLLIACPPCARAQEATAAPPPVDGTLDAPEATLAPPGGEWEGWTSGGGATVTNIEAPLQFAVMCRDGQNVLLVLRQRGGAWQTEFIARAALRPGDPPGVSPEADGARLSLFYYGEGDALERYVFADDGTGRYIFCAYDARRVDGSYLAVDYATPGTLRYSETSPSGGLAVTTLPDHHFYTDLESFDASAFPVTMAQAVALGAPGAEAVTAALVREDASLGDNARQLPDQPLLDAQNGQIVARVFAGAEAEVLEDPGADWLRVRVGTLEGWILRASLAFGADRLSVTRRPPAGMVVETQDRPMAGFYADLRDPGTLLSEHCTEVGDLMRVLAVLPDGWLHARNMNGDAGYIETLFVTQCADAWASEPRAHLLGYVRNPDPADRLHLRIRPNKEALSLGKYYSGTQVTCLFEEAHTPGWRAVRVGDRCGYMMEEYLAFPGEFDPGWLPPIALTTRECPLRLDITAETELLVLPQGAQVNVLGVLGDGWLHVQANADHLGWGGQTGYLRESELTRVGPAVPAEASVIGDTPGYALHERDAEQLRQLHHGDVLHLAGRSCWGWAYGWVEQGDEKLWVYAPTDCLWISGDHP